MDDSRAGREFYHNFPYLQKPHGSRDAICVLSRRYVAAVIAALLPMTSGEKRQEVGWPFN